MGNCHARKPQKEEPHVGQQKVLEGGKTVVPPTQETVARLPRSHFICENKKNEQVLRLPGSLSGQQFKIENCESSQIYVFDHTTTVFIDDCKDCDIFIGPCKASIFVRNCTNCRMVLVCEQYRSRECKNITTSLYCSTQPIIESSSDMQFSCFNYAYPGLEVQLKAAGFSVWRNNWQNIYDYTPNHNLKLNYQILSVEDSGIKTLLPSVNDAIAQLPQSDQFDYQLSIPYTSVVSPKQHIPLQLAIIGVLPEHLFERGQGNLVKDFNHLSNQGICLSRTQAIHLSSDPRAVGIFDTDKLSHSMQGDDNHNIMVFIEIRGATVTQVIQKQFANLKKFKVWTQSSHNFEQISKLIFEESEEGLPIQKHK